MTGFIPHPIPLSLAHTYFLLPLLFLSLNLDRLTKRITVLDSFHGRLQVILWAKDFTLHAPPTPPSHTFLPVLSSFYQSLARFKMHHGITSVAETNENARLEAWNTSISVPPSNPFRPSLRSFCCTLSEIFFLRRAIDDAARNYKYNKKDLTGKGFSRILPMNSCRFCLLWFCYFLPISPFLLFFSLSSLPSSFPSFHHALPSKRKD